MITILIVDSNARLAQVMAQLLDDDRRFHVVGVAGAVTDALRDAKAHAPDVVLVSQQVDATRGEALCAALRSVSPASVLLLWSHAADAPPPADADGMLERGMTYSELARAVREAARHAAGVVDLTRQAETSVRT